MKHIASKQLLSSLEDPGCFWDALEGPVHQTSEIAARLHRGKIAFRVERCLWADVMQQLDDPELSHTFTCYGDVPQIGAINPNFVLTRAMTLMRGAPYCDTCSHDRRHVGSIEHPSRGEFFNSLGIAWSQLTLDSGGMISNASTMSRHSGTYLPADRRHELPSASSCGEPQHFGPPERCMSEKGGMNVNEAIQVETMRMLLKERLDRAERARLVRCAMKHRASYDQDRPKAKALRTTCRRTGQAAY